MTYIHKHELLEPDHSTATEAQQRLSPIVGTIMLAWNEVERLINRNIRDDRLVETGVGEAPRRQLSQSVKGNVDEWIRRFMPEPSNGFTSDELRKLLLGLKTVRDDLAHNILNYAVDPQLGPFINRVRENTDFYRQETAYLERIRSGDKRNVPAEPRQFELYCYLEEGLICAVTDMTRIEPSLLRIYADGMRTRYPPREPRT